MSNDPLADLRRADLEDLLRLPAFNRFLWDVLWDAGWMHQTFTGEALSSAFNEGRRALANQIMSKCLALRDDALVQVLHEGATTLAPLIKGQQAPDDGSSYLYRGGDSGDASSRREPE